MKEIYWFAEIRKTNYGSFKVKDFDRIARGKTEAKKIAKQLLKKVRKGNSVGIFNSKYELVGSIKKR